MTKHDLIRALEPFDDDIEIVFRDHENDYTFTPNVYYVVPNNDYAKIVLGRFKPNSKAVELKV